MNVILETLNNGLFRCTVRHHGATLAFVDHSEPRQAVLAAMRQGAAGHMLHDGSFDMTHLELNDAAKQALAEAQTKALVPAAEPVTLALSASQARHLARLVEAEWMRFHDKPVAGMAVALAELESLRALLPAA